MRKITTLILVAIVVLITAYTSSPVRADELDDINSQLNKLTKELEASRNATKPLEEDLNRLRKQLADIKSHIANIEIDIGQKEKQINIAEKELVKQKNIINERVFAHYKNIKKTQASLLDILLTDNLSVSLQNFFYQKKAVDNDKQEILRIVLFITNIDDQKEALAREQEKLAQVKLSVDKQSSFLSGEIGKAKDFQNELSGKIASLTGRQQSLIGQKLASLNIPRSAGTSARGCSSDLTNGKNPGFSPAIGFFTYGAPHRVGMNQYGAKGRADVGQNYEQILRAYYNFDSFQKLDTRIKVENKGEFSLEDYALRIYEVPESWPSEVLKAQAIAARSFAIAYINDRRAKGQPDEICTSQDCQVFNDNPKTGPWVQAVKDTEGLVMVQGGNPIKAWYASTHGGYAFTSAEIWGGSTSWTKHITDTSSGSAGSFDDLKNNAFDRSSPWFYCNWGARSQYDGTAWLKSDEVADIANVILLARYSDVDKDHLYQVDKPNPTGKETWDAEKVKSELGAKGGNPVGDGANASVSVDFGSGKTSSVNVGGTSFSAAEFKDWFNLRAPANIQIVGPLFNIEKK